MAKIEQLIQRADGKEVKIVAESFYGLGLHRSVGVFVLHRDTPDQPWQLASDRPQPDWRTMSVSDYVKHGRPPKFQLASHGEILKVSQALLELEQGVAA